MDNLTSILVLTLLISLAPSCSRHESGNASPSVTPLTPAPTKLASPAPAPIIFPSTVPSALPLAHRQTSEHHEYLASLKSYDPTVNYRRSRELVWQPVQPRLSFERFDAIQTQVGGTASVRFKSGSELEIQPGTLIVIDRDPSLRKKPKEDRVVLREGKLEGHARRELWLLTSAALLKIKPRPKAPPAKIDISVHEGGKLRVELASGQGTLISQTSKGGIKRRILQPRVPIELQAPKRHEPLAAPLPEPLWDRLAKAARAPSPSPSQAAPLVLTLLEPRDQAIVSQDKTLVRGKLSGPDGRILINGKPVAVENDLSFSVQVPLNRGANLITIQMISPDGKSQFQRRTVIRDSREQNDGK